MGSGLRRLLIHCTDQLWAMGSSDMSSRELIWDHLLSNVAMTIL